MILQADYCSFLALDTKFYFPQSPFSSTIHIFCSCFLQYYNHHRHISIFHQYAKQAVNTFLSFSQQIKQQEILRSKAYQSKNITRIHAKTCLR